MSRPHTLAGVLGTIATLLAAATVFAPWLPGVGLLAEAVEGGGGLLVGASLSLGLYLAWLAWAPGPVGTDEGNPFEAALATPPERATADDQPRVAADLRADVAAATGGDGDALATVREHLRETATDAHAHVRDCGRATARAAVADGAWTTDDVAAAVLADATGPDHALVARLRLWLDPERERERRLRRTVAAIRRVVGEEG